MLKVKEKKKISLNISKKDPRKDYKIDGLTIENIIKKYKKGEMFKTFIIYENNNCLWIHKNNSLTDIIFLEPKETCYQLINNKESKIHIDKEVYSTVQIDEKINSFGATKVFFSSGQLRCSYFNNKHKLPEEKKLNIFYVLDSYTFKDNHDFLNNLKDVIEKKEFSKYFDEYFKYDVGDNNNKTFRYYKTDKRKNLEKNFLNLYYGNNITKFKITGPSNDGKSTTLLFLSRTVPNVVYLNLKVINSLYEERKIDILLDLLIYEFGRIWFLKEEHKKEFQEEFNKSIEQTPWIILTNLINNLIKNKQKIVLILDQYKSTTVDNKFIDNLEKNLNDMLKILISFSISDNKDFEHIANSLKKNKGNPPELTEKNQEDYFYYSNLFDTTILKKPGNESEKYKLFNLFDFNPKYIYLVKHSGIDFINNKINAYFEEHSKEIGINNVHAYLFNYSKSINNEYSFDDLFNITTKIPMKYTYLVIKNNCFELKYQFNYIKTLIDKKMQFTQVRQYFLDNKDKDNYFEKKFKGDYFEYLACETMKKNKDIFFNKQIKNVLTVKDIISMGRYEEPNNDEMIIENYDNLNLIKKIKIKDYYQEKIKLLDGELNNLKVPPPELSEDKKNIIFSKELLKKKRILELNDIKKNKNEKDSKKGNKKKQKKKEIKTKKDITTKKGKEGQNKNESQNELNTDEKIDLEDEINITSYKKDFVNNGMIISQKNICGKTLDLAAMLGDSPHKKFIGFQIKYYERGTHLKEPQNLLKSNLKEKMKQILLNCPQEFKINITEWHYFFCIYYNPKENYSYNKSIVNICNKYDIEYIFFDPLEEQFYHRDLTPIKEEIHLSFRSNLDCYTSTNPYEIFKNNDLLEDFAIQRSEKSDSLIINKKIFNSEKSIIIKKLNSITGDLFEDICMFTYNLKFPFPTPEKNYLFLFESKDKNSFIYYYNKNDKDYMCGELNKNNTKYDAGLISSYINYKGKEEIPFYVLKLKEKKTKN